MLQKARAIALHSVRYGESSIVAYLYSCEFGRLTLMVNGAYGKGRKAGKAVFFQPLSLIDIVYYTGKNNGMGRLKEVSPSFVSVSVSSSPIKSAIALFVGEVIYRTVREEEGNHPLYTFLELSIKSLDAIESGVANFHLIFLSHLSKYLGFYPHGQFSEQTPYFDFRNGIFVAQEPLHAFYFSSLYSKILYDTLILDYDNANQLSLNGTQRSSFLDLILSYYQYHNDSSTTFQSLPVLQQVFMP
ncbi:MAG: recombination protein O N-terminal domain-containing protein [Bacteroidales bacterium]|jgi:DNA repair protein RecO (recombination protein O)|nr:recombination protein O N-terminal domain-containing protein [Bacteroidales bacterium]MDD4384182.1 recombination protein O N-terminal domain-containing protein [Bacteroidales bacterium]MDY0197808.1 recombination protein O N-terminal domain-containing protein [Tenuifilaceae bacterium]